MEPGNDCSDTHHVAEKECKVQAAGSDVVKQQLLEVRLLLFEEHVLNEIKHMVPEREEEIRVQVFGRLLESPLKSSHDVSIRVLATKVPGKPN